MQDNRTQAGTNPAFFGSERGGSEPANYRKHPHGEGGTLARPTRGGWGERGSTPAHRGGSACQLRPPAPKGGGGAVLAGAGWGFPPLGGTGGGCASPRAEMTIIIIIAVDNDDRLSA